MADHDTTRTPYNSISFVVSDWMIYPDGLDLSNTDLLVYAMIHSASTMSNTSLAMTLAAVSDALNVSLRQTKRSIASLAERGYIIAKGEAQFSKRGNPTKLWASDPDVAFDAQRRVMAAHRDNPLEDVEKFSTGFEQVLNIESNTDGVFDNQVTPMSPNSPDQVTPMSPNRPDQVTPMSPNRPDQVTPMSPDRRVLNNPADVVLPLFSSENDASEGGFSTKTERTTYSKAYAQSQAKDYLRIVENLRKGRPTKEIDTLFDALSAEDRGIFDRMTRNAWRWQDRDAKHLYHREAKAVYLTLIRSGMVRGDGVLAEFERLRKQIDADVARGEDIRNYSSYSLSNFLKKCMKKLTGVSWNSWLEQRPIDLTDAAYVPEKPSSPDGRGSCDEGEGTSATSPAASTTSRSSEGHGSRKGGKAKVQALLMRYGSESHWGLTGDGVKPDFQMWYAVCAEDGTLYGADDAELVREAVVSGKGFCVDPSVRRVEPIGSALVSLEGFTFEF